jgi:acetate---CoA ligase (ADP-forming)
VYPVNPRGGEILGWQCRASLDDVDQPIDVALISLPATLVPESLEACAARNIRLAVVLTAGVDTSAPPPSGLLVMGPNSMGFLNARLGAGAAWSSSLDLQRLRAGHVALISQSGAMGGSILNRLQDRGVGLSYTFWTGNETYIDTCHLLNFVLDDPETSVVAMLVEGFHRPAELLRLAQVARERRKPLVVWKLVQSDAAAPMAVAHTGILAGAARTWSAAFRQYGIVEVNGLDELVDTTALFARVPLPLGDGLGMVSSSGGAGVLVTDLCAELGVRLTELTPETIDDIRAMLPSYAPEPSNPLDITAGLSEQALFDPLERIARDPGVDLVLNVVTMLGGAGRMRSRGENLIAAQQRIEKPVVSCWTAGSLGDDGMRLLAEADLPYFTAPEICLRSIKSLFEYRRRAERSPAYQRPAELEAPRLQVRAALLALRARGQRVLGERESSPLLAAYGLPLVESRSAATAAEAQAQAAALGFPVVLKADVTGLAHKERVGGVQLGLSSAERVAAAFDSIRTSVAEAGLTSDFRGVLVQPEAPSGLEAVLGIARDPQLGPQILLGLGGVFAEALAQVAVRLAPLSPSDAADLIESTPFRAIGARAALREALVRLGWFAVDTADLVAECDLNPLRLAGERLLALDALLVLRPTD